MKATVLDKPPISGSIEEIRYEARGGCTWVLFDPPDSEPWAGVFGKGLLPARNRVALFADGGAAFVVAGGQGYSVDLRDRRLLHRADQDDLCRVLALPETDFVVCADYTRLLAFSREGLCWTSDRVALDGIILDAASRTQVTGKV